jgi:hypothetical protein
MPAEPMTYDQWLENEAVHVAAETYAEQQMGSEHPQDAEDAAALYEEAVFAGCVAVYGPKAAFEGLRRFREAG